MHRGRVFEVDVRHVEFDGIDACASDSFDRLQRGFDIEVWRGS